MKLSFTLMYKRVKKGKFSFNNTDVRVGDQLLFIDNAPVSRGMTFSDTMKLLKEKMLSARADEEQDNDIFSFSFTTNRLKPLKKPGPIRKRGDSLSKSAAQQFHSRLVLTFRTLGMFYVKCFFITFLSASQKTRYSNYIIRGVQENSQI